MPHSTITSLRVIGIAAATGKPYVSMALDARHGRFGPACFIPGSRTRRYSLVRIEEVFGPISAERIEIADTAIRDNRNRIRAGNSPAVLQPAVTMTIEAEGTGVDLSACGGDTISQPEYLQ